MSDPAYGLYIDGCIERLMRDKGMTYEEACKHIEVNSINLVEELQKPELKPRRMSEIKRNKLANWLRRFLSGERR